MWLRRNGLLLAAGLAAALPVIASTVQAVAAGWLPTGDDAIIAVRAFDVFSTHPPVLGQYSASSAVIGAPVLSPGPMLYWLLALPVRLGEVAPTIAMGLFNTAAVVGVVALARRRGGRALMLVTAAAVAVMSGSLGASTLSDVWNPAAAVFPLTLLIFLGWSLACGEYRLLPLTALVASFTVQAQLTYVLPSIAVLVVGLGFLAASRPAIPRRRLAATLAIVVVCWSLPLAEQAVHRPGNIARTFQVATANTPTLGAAAGWHAVVHAVGLPAWWFQGPRSPLARLIDVNYAPGAVATATAVLALLALAGVALAALRSRRRDLAAAALIALGLMLALALVTASTPTENGLFGVISYTLWWAAPAGMFGWLVLGLAAATFLPARIPGPARLRLAAAGRRIAVVVGVAAVAAIGAVVASHGRPNRLERAFGPARRIADRVRARTPPGATVLIVGSPATEVGTDLVGVVAYALRGDGVPFVVGSLPGIGTRYDPGRHRYGRRIDLIERPTPAQAGGDVLARVVLDGVPSDAPPRQRAARTVVVKLSRASASLAGARRPPAAEARRSLHNDGARVARPKRQVESAPLSCIRREPDGRTDFRRSAQR